jgi:calcineurin-like phosphoesterase family protein
MIMSKNFYIADLHFGHKNIIRYDNRPFISVNEMDNVLIKNWNYVVSNDDFVYILGDISWYDDSRTVDIFSRLNGHKILIKGNHDKISSYLRTSFDKVVDYLEINDNGNKVVMSHYPMPFWNGQFRDSVHLYGHIHNSRQWNMMESWREELKQLQDIPGRMYNVGCMISYMNYTPRTLDEILLLSSGWKQVS